MCPDLCLRFPAPGFVWSLFAMVYAFHMYVLEGLCVQYYVLGFYFVVSIYVSGFYSCFRTLVLFPACMGWGGGGGGVRA